MLWNVWWLGWPFSGLAEDWDFSARREAAEETLEHSTLLVSIRQCGLVSLSFEMPLSFLWVLNGAIGKEDTGNAKNFTKSRQWVYVGELLTLNAGIGSSNLFSYFEGIFKPSFPCGKSPGVQLNSPASGEVQHCHLPQNTSLLPWGLAPWLPALGGLRPLPKSLMVCKNLLFWPEVVSETSSFLQN